ncbi:GNAT family N-acetyltransferase [Novosphingobium mangrovi (ex Huang et al. 2023)]|uniref:GNAT family N-acetyltransferase n=1 Tax=Novosphingobium mangrovi (ex Huang et al. 2023) TaxID=2976432 RepID=A0ABT2I9I9_9SPHN|nr:GNAT family N-acetyltransferase [Novosphingobium mangrovi (ex Huang et al. 2023)]MCT2401172.1 GNAT family N-acetyltransferase [Novosphingobium mangrovi (ex Huang et al. 2023)]
MIRDALTIRAANLADAAILPAIERSAALLFEDVAGSEALVGRPVIDQATHARWMGESAYLVAEWRQRKRVGFLAARPGGAGALTIIELSVRRAFQRRGIGRALLERCLADARSRRIGEVWLQTDLTFPWDAAFYLSMGFEVAGPPALSSRVQLAARDDPRSASLSGRNREWMVCRLSQGADDAMIQTSTAQRA